MAEETMLLDGVEQAAGVDQFPQDVVISDVGPCKKHVKVTIERTVIDGRFNEKFSELTKDAKVQLRGFRPGKAPRKVIERRYKPSVAEEVRTELLMASLEQLANNNLISPLAPPDLNPAKLIIPEDGPFIYEFDVEVRPEFDLPNYKGLKLKRPMKTFSEEDILKEKRRLLEPQGQLVPKEGDDTVVELNDYVIADVNIRDGDRVINKLNEVRVKVDRRLVLTDGVAENFGSKMKGAKAGEKRDIDITLSTQVADASLQNKVITAEFEIKDIKVVRLPEMTPVVLSQFGVRSEEQLDEVVASLLERRLEYVQRQSARGQILGLIAEAASWELPQDMLIRQAGRAMNRKVLEMRSSGMTEDQISARSRLLTQDIVQSTAASLREHFVLQKIAEIEKLEIEESDINAEVERIADQEGENPRRVRARLEREDLIEALATELLERKALQIVLDNAEYEDEPVEEEDQEESLAEIGSQAVPGEMHTPTVSTPVEENSNPA
jgi:trigger factor